MKDVCDHLAPSRSLDDPPPSADALTQLIGETPPHQHLTISPEGVVHAAAFRPRGDDVFILTPPKTGTTWMQMLCHALRTQGCHSEFEDIYQVVPWDQLAWDLGQSLDDEQVALPRLFKSHQRLSAISRGARYLCLVRRVEDVLSSWWNFLRLKDIPPLKQYGSASEFAFDEGFFAKDMRFGATIWDYYVEFFRARRLPSVLVLCYEDLVEDLEGHLPIIVDFLGLEAAVFQDPTTRARVLQMCSREGMREMASKFDESWTFVELQRVGRMRDPGSFSPSARVNSQSSSEALTDAAQEFLCDRWREQVFCQIGLPDYAALRQAVNDEVAARLSAIGSTLATPMGVQGVQ